MFLDVVCKVFILLFMELVMLIIKVSLILNWEYVICVFVLKVKVLGLNCWILYLFIFRK